MKEEILALLGSDSYHPMDLHELQAYFHKEKDIAFMKLLVEMEENHEVIRSSSNKYHLPDRLGLVKGYVQMNKKGFAFIRLEDDSEEVFVSREHMHHAMQDDLVMVRIIRRRPEENPEGEIIAILDHGLKKAVGEFVKSRKKCFVRCDDPKYPSKIFIDDAHTLGAMPGHKVVVEIQSYEPNISGEIVKIIGHKNDPGVDILSVVERYDVDIEFSEEIYREIEAIPESVLPEERKGRRDFRDWQIITIDGDDAKDLDDAISLTRSEDGIYHLGVHIADVSHYVRENTPLDKEAVARGTSIYLVDRVIPMLPHKLSNGICSLNEGVDRLTLSCLMDVNAQGEVINHEIVASVIRSQKRMTYRHVNEILAGNEKRRIQYSELVELLERMQELAHILSRKRKARGAIDFDTKEAKIIVNDKSQAVDIAVRERGEGERLIEDFMLLANETVAEHFKWMDLPYIYRIHEKPQLKKLQRLALLLGPLGYHLHGSLSHIHPRELASLVDESKGQPEHTLIATTMLRCMQKAKYSPECLGHFGLADEYYTHFTSPIRRYPDLLGHRLIHTYLIDGDMSSKTQSKYAEILPDLAEQCSLREVVAVDLEREVEDVKKAEYMSAHIGEEFDGYISSITRFGFFVELANTVDGLVHLSELKDDYYYFDEVNTTLIGERTGKVFHLCDPIRVRVTGANKDEGTVDFTIVKTKKEKGKKKSKAKTSQRNERATRRVDQRLKKAKAKTSSFEPFMKKKNKRRR